ncbi:MAG: FapA family protein [Treponema sp.]|nr:FapA family protein [Treponema sp.]
MVNEKDVVIKKDDSSQQTGIYGGLNDGYVTISYSDNSLEAYADFTPPFMNGKPLDVSGIARFLDSNNIVFGVQWDDIEIALEECNMTRRHVPGILIAIGVEPVEEVIEYYKINSLLNRKKKVITGKDRIDHRERSPFIIVKQGQILAVMHPRKPGKEGTNVHGQAIHYETIRPDGVTSGTNTTIEGNKIISNIHGQLINSNGVLSVQEHLIIKGAVGYRTGHIVFPGDVKIDGPVSDGFKIYSGGSIVVKQTLDLTEIVANGDIMVSGGVIGKGAGRIKCGGGLKTKFIESCSITARGAVIVESGIINSKVFSLDTVRMGDKGLILGGEIYSLHGLRAGGIGKKRSKATYIHCGIDFAIQQEMDKCINQLRILGVKLAKLRGIIDDPGTGNEKKAKLMDLFHKLESEKQSVTVQLTELSGKVKADDEATIEVLGEIAASTLIEICNVALYVVEPLRKVRIRLDKSAGKLIVESLK